MIFYGLFSTSLRDQSSGVLKDALCRLLKNFSEPRSRLFTTWTAWTFWTVWTVL